MSIKFVYSLQVKWSSHSLINDSTNPSTVKDKSLKLEFVGKLDNTVSIIKWYS